MTVLCICLPRPRPRLCIVIVILIYLATARLAPDQIMALAAALAGLLARESHKPLPAAETLESLR